MNRFNFMNTTMLYVVFFCFVQSSTAQQIPHSCGTMQFYKQGELDRVKEFDVPPHLHRGASTWSLNAGYGNGCVKDCVIATPTTCTGGEDVYKLPIVVTVSTAAACASGYTAPTQAEVDENIELLNDYYKCTDIPIQFVKATNYTNAPTSGDGSTRFQNLGCTYDASNVSDIPNVLNLYIFQNTSIGTGYNGFAFLPTGATGFDKVVMSASAISDLNYTGALNCSMLPIGLGTVLIHEMGHYLGLYHTHGTYAPGTSGNGYSGVISQELVNGANGCTSGDYIKDTPADLGISHALDPFHATDNPVGGCATKPGNCTTVSFGSSPSSCTDSNGATYNPDLTNIMNYNNSGSCRNTFTVCQKTKMVDALLFGRSYLCNRDIALEFGTNASAYDICVGDVAPNFTALNTCYNWYNELGGSATLLATGNSFTPSIGTNAGQLDNMTPGTYTWYLGDLNEYNSDCRTAVTITVLANPGSGSEMTTGSSNIVVAGCNTSSSITLQTDAPSMGPNNIVGWWITEAAPISNSVTDDASLTAAFNAATQGGTLSNTVNNYYQSTNGSPVTEYDLAFDCSSLNPNETYYATPFLANYSPSVADQNCSASSGSTSSIAMTISGQTYPGRYTSIAPSSISCRPNNSTASPTYTITVSITGYVGDPEDLSLLAREDNFNGTDLLVDWLAGSNGNTYTYTYTQTDTNNPSYDPGDPALSTGLTFIAWEQGDSASGANGNNNGNGMQSATIAVTVGVTYEGDPGVPFPSTNSYNDCFFGSPIVITCNCLSSGCVPSEALAGTVNNTNEAITTSNLISSTQVITGNSNVMYQSSCIELNYPFEVNTSSGATFLAEINPCASFTGGTETAENKVEDGEEEQK